MTTYAYWLRGADYVEQATLSIASVRRVDPRARIFVCTDDPHSTPHIEGTVRSVLEGGRPKMVANLDAQVAVMAEMPYRERVLFLDSDTLMRQPFPWKPTADLYVTWRDHVNGDAEMAKQQPYNYGVVGCIATARTLELFFWLRARVLQMTPMRQDWWGNQLALADLLGAPRTEPWWARIRWTLTDRGTPFLVQPLPCDVWNYSPDAPGEDVSAKGILHLKGKRKEMMQAYAEAA